MNTFDCLAASTQALITSINQELTPCLEMANNSRPYLDERFAFIDQALAHILAVCKDISQNQANGILRPASFEATEPVNQASFKDAEVQCDLVPIHQMSKRQRKE